MSKKTLIVAAVGLLSLMPIVPAQAQEGATVVLKSGQRQTGELLDLNGSSFVLRINGQEQSFSKSDVVAVEYPGAAPNPDAQARAGAGRPVVVMRNGEIIEGRMADLSGTRPQKLTIEMSGGGTREVMVPEVAAAYFGPTSPQAVATTGQAAQPGVGAGTSITVPANQPWTDTGISVSRGERIVFSGSGDINFAEGPGKSSGVGGSPLGAGGKLPVGNAPLGALIGRVGTGTPFLIGSNPSPITMPANGRLLLGVNDEHFPDNSGNYTVSIQRLGR